MLSAVRGPSVVTTIADTGAAWPIAATARTAAVPDQTQTT
jgi:hypothetical protein